MQTTRELLEGAIARDFEDLAAHAAYADLLMEEGDPRGEYIQLRLLLGDENRPVAQLQRARQRAAELYQRHEEEWLGDLAPFLVNPRRSIPEPVAPNIEFTFRRGWISELHVQEVRDAFLTVVADAPQIRMVQNLTLVNTLQQRTGYASLAPLVESPYLSTLRSLTLGEVGEFSVTASGRDVEGLLRKTPGVEEVTLFAADLSPPAVFGLTLPFLGKLHIDYAFAFPLRVLARNSSLSSLTHLLLDSRWYLNPRELESGENDDAAVEAFLSRRREYLVSADDVSELCASAHLRSLTHLRLRLPGFDDRCCDVLAQSGMLKRLRWLDLRDVDITDAGAEILANCPDLEHLEWLDVGGNLLTPVGIGLLTSRDVRVQYDSQRGDSEYAEEPV